MSISQRISAFSELGRLFLTVTNNDLGTDKNSDTPESRLRNALNYAEIKNPWFTQENLKHRLNYLGHELTEENLGEWSKNFNPVKNEKKIGLILKGDIPLAGFYHLISILLSGNSTVIKTAEKDKTLWEFVCEFLKSSNEDLNNSIQTAERLKDLEAVIAAGDNHTLPYFEQYFKNIPHKIIQNKTSVAVLSGDESDDELKDLADDIFTYFGLGHFNTFKIYLPEGFSTDRIFNGLYDWNQIINHNKYANNYDYNRSLYLLAEEPFLDNNFVMLKESADFRSPAGTVFYECYKDLEILKDKLGHSKDRIIQISGKGFDTPIGKSLNPTLLSHPENTETFDFLNSL